MPSNRNSRKDTGAVPARKQCLLFHAKQQEFDEAEFLNALCESSGCGLLGLAQRLRQLPQ